MNIIRIRTYFYGKMVNERFYIDGYEDIEEVRKVYIQNLRIDNTSQFVFLNLLNKYHKKYIEEGVIPYDNNFYFTEDILPIYNSQGYTISTGIPKNFYEYGFYINDDINLQFYYTSDDEECRYEFINEVEHLLKSYAAYNIYNKLKLHINNFIQSDAFDLSENIDDGKIYENKKTDKKQHLRLNNGICLKDKILYVKKLRFNRRYD